MIIIHDRKIIYTELNPHLDDEDIITTYSNKGASFVIDTNNGGADAIYLNYKVNGIVRSLNISEDRITITFNYYDPDTRYYYAFGVGRTMRICPSWVTDETVWSVGDNKDYVDLSANPIASSIAEIIKDCKQLGRSFKYKDVKNYELNNITHPTIKKCEKFLVNIDHKLIDPLCPADLCVPKNYDTKMYLTTKLETFYYHKKKVFIKRGLIITYHLCIRMR